MLHEVVRLESFFGDSAIDIVIAAGAAVDLAQKVQPLQRRRLGEGVREGKGGKGERARRAQRGIWGVRDETCARNQTLSTVLW